MIFSPVATLMYHPLVENHDLCQVRAATWNQTCATLHLVRTSDEKILEFCHLFLVFCLSNGMDTYILSIFFSQLIRRDDGLLSSATMTFLSLMMLMYRMVQRLLRKTFFDDFSFDELFRLIFSTNFFPPIFSTR